jgi:N-acetylmuramoyl-L-alanine amidase
VNFPWKQLADSGYGLWWDDTSNISVPPAFNPMQALRVVGYDIRDTSAAIQTFKRKYEQLDKDSVFTSADLKVLFMLYKKYQ